MLCSKCGCEMVVERLKDEEGNLTGEVRHTCINPRCTDFLKEDREHPTEIKQGKPAENASL